MFFREPVCARPHVRAGNHWWWAFALGYRCGMLARRFTHTFLSLGLGSLALACFSCHNFIQFPYFSSSTSITVHHRHLLLLTDLISKWSAAVLRKSNELVLGWSWTNGMDQKSENDQSKHPTACFEFCLLCGVLEWKNGCCVICQAFQILVAR